MDNQSEILRRRKTRNTITKKKGLRKDSQWSTKYCTENERISNTKQLENGTISSDPEGYVVIFYYHPP